MSTVSKVYPENGGFTFMASLQSEEHGTRSKRYAYEQRDIATRNRARLIKALKGDGFKVLMVN